MRKVGAHNSFRRMALGFFRREMMQASLWGNATDLSLLVDLKYEDLQALQSVGAAAQAENAKYILRNDLPKVWEHVKTLKAGARVDFVLDNGEMHRLSRGWFRRKLIREAILAACCDV